MTPIGELNPEVVLNADGTGLVAIEFGTVEIFDAVYNGDSVTFSAKVQMPMGEFDLTFAGTVSGDDLSGSLGSAMGTFGVTGVRQS